MAMLAFEAFALAHEDLRLGGVGPDGGIGKLRLLMAASSLSSRAWSKILPKVADFIAHRSVGEFEFIQHDGF